MWDRKQGHIRDAQARWVKAQAAVHPGNDVVRHHGGGVRSLSGRFQVEKLAREVLPRLQESLDLLLKGYELGGGGVTFNDVLLTEQSLIAARLTLTEARQTLWQAIADLQGLMQLDIQADVHDGPHR